MHTPLARYLARHDMSQAEFARRHKLPIAQISLWSNGHRRPGIGNAILLEKATLGEVTVAQWAARRRRVTGGARR